MKTYTLYWLDGKREVIQGRTIEHAFNKAGIGAGAIPKLDFFTHGEDHKYEWDKEKRDWIRK